METGFVSQNSHENLGEELYDLTMKYSCLPTCSMFDSQFVVVFWEILETWEGGVCLEVIEPLVHVLGDYIVLVPSLSNPSALIIYPAHTCVHSAFCLQRGRHYP